MLLVRGMEPQFCILGAERWFLSTEPSSLKPKREELLLRVLDFPRVTDNQREKPLKACRCREGGATKMEYCGRKKNNTMHLLLYMLIKSQMNQLKKNLY